MALSTLPKIDVPILKMFAHLPIVDLLTVGQVTPSWKSFARTECHRRRELTLLIGRDCDISVTDNYEFSVPFAKELAALNAQEDSAPFKQLVAQLPAANTTEWSCVQYDDLTELDAQLLLETFPNISRLGIVQKRNHPFPPVSALLDGWKSSVTSLKMWYICEDNTRPLDTIQSAVQSQMDSVNSLGALKHFTLEMKIKNLSGFYSLDLPFLSRLTDFVHNCEMLSKWDIAQSLFRYGIGNQQLKSFSLKTSFWMGIFPPTPDRFLQLAYQQPKFCGKFTHLIIRQHFPSIELPQLAKYCSITSLSIVLTEPISQFARHLQPLKQLIHLTLYFPLFQYYPISDLNVTLESTPQLSYVRVLTIFISNLYEDDIDPSFGSYFPNLMGLELLHNLPYECPFCGHLSTTMDIQAKMCIHNLLAEPFKQCTKLTKFRATVAKGITTEEININDVYVDMAWPIDLE